MVRLADVALSDAAGVTQVTIHRAETGLTLGMLLRGRAEPRTLQLEGVSATVQRAADGTLSVASMGASGRASPAGSASFPVAILQELARPPHTGDAPAPGLGALRRVDVRDASLIVKDQQLGTTWQVSHAALQLERGPEGGATGHGDLMIALGDQSVPLAVAATLSAGSAETRLRAELSPVVPAALARSVPRLTPLAAVDAPVSGEGELRLGPDLQVRDMRLALRAATGTARIVAGAVPFLSAALTISGTPQQVTLQAAQVELRGHPGGPVSRIRVQGSGQRSAGAYAAALTLDLDRVDVADLPRLWPAGVGGGARPWILENVVAGRAHDGHFDIGLGGSGDLSDVRLTRASGLLQGSGLTVHWLRPVPPLQRGEVVVRVLDPDTVDIDLSSGQQVPERRQVGPLTLQGGRVHITGLAHKDQDGTIRAAIAGPVAAALAVLANPRLHLLSDHPLPLTNPAGSVKAILTVSLPLLARVTISQVRIQARAELAELHLSAVVAGRDLDAGRFTLAADDNGLTLRGRSKLAGMAANVAAAMDFRAGPPGQILQRITVIGRPDARQLAAAGLDVGNALAGPLGLQSIYTERRGKLPDLGVLADLTPAALRVAVLGWQKPAGTAATARARVVFKQGRIIGIEGIELSGERLAARGRAEFADGRPTRLTVSKLVFGRNDARGLIRFASGGRPLVATVSGPLLDLSSRLAGAGSLKQSTEPTKIRRQPNPGTPAEPWRLDAHFDRVILANGRTAAGLDVRAENDGQLLRAMRLSGAMSARGPVSVEIAPAGNGRSLRISAADAGALLNGLGVPERIKGGRLAVSARFEDRQPGRPLSGTAEMRDFRLRGVPTLAKVLQTVTLYGLVNALRGPGMGFSRLVVPFRLQDQTLDIADARAFNASLGATAKGRIDFAAARLDMRGTIVPAYFF
ncbi:MAG: AsmA-like C-terminal region-containing protein, partial [Pseudomonadota bacterium]|nr:AsmA-like C-terminal region-containing protein [Pseudomonadota bacterium]